MRQEVCPFTIDSTAGTLGNGTFRPLYISIPRLEHRCYPAAGQSFQTPRELECTFWAFAMQMATTHLPGGPANEAHSPAARSPPLGRGEHPARQDRGAGLQELHPVADVLQAPLRPVGVRGRRRDRRAGAPAGPRLQREAEGGLPQARRAPLPDPGRLALGRREGRLDQPRRGAHQGDARRGERQRRAARRLHGGLEPARARRLAASRSSRTRSSTRSSSTSTSTISRTRASRPTCWAAPTST